MRRRRTLLFALLALAAAALGVLATHADGYVATGAPWPGGVIRYYNAATDQRWAVEKAVEAWNLSGARVRFVPVPAAQAQLRIEHFRTVSCTINSSATIGYTRSARIYIFKRDERSAYCNSYMAAQTVVHELGHVLGLDHELRSCARMNPDLTLQGPSLCAKAELWQWRCQLLTPDDVDGAIALYGGTRWPQRGARDCDIYAGSNSPADLAVSWTEAPEHVRVTFRRPASVAVPYFLARQRKDPEAFVVGATTKRCATDAHAFSRYPWTVRAGGIQDKVLHLSPGVYCLTVWAVDSFARPSSRPAVLWVRI